MNSLQYKQALADARNVDNPADEAQLEIAAEKKSALGKWWEEKTREYLREVKNTDLDERRKNWKSYTYDYDLDPFGYVTVYEHKNDERGIFGEPTVWKVNKVDIFDLIDEQELMKQFRANSRKQFIRRNSSSAETEVPA